MLVCINVIIGVINPLITITLSPAEAGAGDLNAYFELVVPAARKLCDSGQGFLLKKLSTQSLLQDLEQGSSTRGPHAALRRVLCGPGRVFHKIQCVMNIEA